MGFPILICIDTRISLADAAMFERAYVAIGVKISAITTCATPGHLGTSRPVTPLLVLKELGNWERIEMAQKYAHPAPTHLASHAKTVTFWPQREQEKKKPHKGGFKLLKR